MKTIAFLTLLLAGTSAFAAPPVKKPVTSYLHLSQNSPFTAKPPPPAGPQAVDNFEDWALGGVSEVEGGYMVTLVHKKNQGETQIIKPRGTVHNAKEEMTWLNPGDPKAFKVDSVKYGKTSWKDTTVTISTGGKTGTVKFDDKQLAPAAAAAPAQNRQQGQPGQPPQPGQAVPAPAAGQPGQQPSNRPPRQRVLPPAPNGQQPQGQGRPNR
ncbi:restriction endonuclease subunit S [Luteolibacter arcticus]|uniref:Restriction endonuclease subunit S n=1 Tax=Luteolibacter arcticus TaxID=1581411 RepID=A0ABT3GBH9_9BACT|nr:restriction endonuclease subunit S [Luteolibacter arcticus]MCW1920929.1 restriction endonuclease subunit S [Luteolibacter arcticus]